MIIGEALEESAKVHMQISRTFVSGSTKKSDIVSAWDTKKSIKAMLLCMLYVFESESTTPKIETLTKSSKRTEILYLILNRM